MKSRNFHLRTVALLVIGFAIGTLIPTIKRALVKQVRPIACKRMVFNRDVNDANQKEWEIPKKKMVFVGVMTAEKFLDTRAKAVYETWGQTLPGKLMFFSSSSSKRIDLPVVSLDGVDDSYPPQKKSLMMLKYMHDNFIDQYEWFIRADDDVYIRSNKLERFLRTLNSSDDLYIGQAGTGAKDEKGMLGLGWADNFCMGGPSMVFSASTLRKVAPYLEHCLKNLYTSHEDVEVGRCIKNFVGISCTWAFEMQSLFYHNRSGHEAFTGNLDTKSVRNAVTMHPIKRPEYMYRLHSFMMRINIQEKMYESVLLHRELKLLEQILEQGLDHVKEEDLVTMNDVKEFNHEMTKESVPTWDMFTARKTYSYNVHSPEIGMLNPTRDGMNNVLGETMSIINKEARKVLHRTLEFKRLNHGYKRFHPRLGMQYMLDLLMKYHRHIGRNRRRMTVHVRHHAYLQQPFGNLLYTIEPERNNNEIIHFVLPLAGRLEIFKRFMANYERISLKTGASTTLTVLYFVEVSSHEEHAKVYQHYRDKYPKAILSWVSMKGTFSRSLGLSVGVQRHTKRALLFFCDVDLEFTAEFLGRCRATSILGEQVYYPSVFSQFKPEIAFRNEQKPNTSFYYTEDAGFWRIYAFGIACLYRYDFDRIGGFDTTIQGWGLEDVDLYDRFVASNNVSVFRSVDPGLIHIFHDVECDKNLAEKQLTMCISSKAQTYGSPRKLFEIISEQSSVNAAEN